MYFKRLENKLKTHFFVKKKGDKYVSGVNIQNFVFSHSKNFLRIFVPQKFPFQKMVPAKLGYRKLT
jgi:hypothetical protein